MGKNLSLAIDKICAKYLTTTGKSKNKKKAAAQ
jgi:hypothetical protein